jgi:hypothetical protein
MEQQAYLTFSMPLVFSFRGFECLMGCGRLVVGGRAKGIEEGLALASVVDLSEASMLPGLLAPPRPRQRTVLTEILALASSTLIS